MIKSFAAIVLMLSGANALAQTPPSWSEPQKPFQVFGNTYYVGTHGLGSVLITSKDGHIIIDGALPTAPQMIVANMRSLGFRIEDVKLILNTHVHFDHAGGIAELQKLSGARVAASPPAAKVLKSGEVDTNDPQFGQLPKIAAVKTVQVIKDGETLRVGALSVTAHFTPGHTPGGTTWTWKSCEQSACANIVYADSLNAISAPGYLYDDANRHPNGAEMLKGSFAVIDELPCDILLTPHPELADVFGKLAKRDNGGGRDAMIDRNSCRAYVQASRERLAKRIADEKAK
jgi:metallo-beta-lactamase class B